MTISMTDQDFEYMRDLQKKGSKPAQIFRNAISQIRLVKETDQFSQKEGEYKKTIGILNGQIIKFNSFLDQTGTRKKYEKWDQDGKEITLSEVE